MEVVADNAACYESRPDPRLFQQCLFDGLFSMGERRQSLMVAQVCPVGIIVAGELINNHAIGFGRGILQQMGIA